MRDSGSVDLSVRSTIMLTARARALGRRPEIAALTAMFRYFRRGV